MSITKDVSVRLSALGAQDVKASLTSITEQADRLGTKTAIVEIDANDDDWEADAAKVLEEAKELGANKVVVKVSADSAGAKEALDTIRAEADLLGLKKVQIKLTVDDSEAKADIAKDAGDILGDKALGDVQNSLSKSTKKGIVDGGNQGGSELPGILGTAMEHPALTAGIVGAIGLAAPFIGQLVGEAVVTGFGAGIAGIAILGASKTAPVKKAFASLKDSANQSLSEIGFPFQGVLTHLLTEAQTTLGKLTLPFAGAASTIATPFEHLGEALLKAFGSPQVARSIQLIGQSFGGLLDAVTPALAQNIEKVATQIGNVAKVVGSNPQAFSDFVGFLFDIAGISLEAVAGLAKVADFLEHNWTKLGPLLVGPFLAMTKPIESAMSKVPGIVGTVWDTIKHQAVIAWDGITDEVTHGTGQVLSQIASWPGKILHALGDLGSLLVNAGKALIGGFIHGIESELGGLMSVLSNITHMIPDHKGPLDLDRVLLVPSGRAIMGGLVTGLNDGLPGLTAQLARTTSVVAHSGVGVAHAGAGAGSGALPNISVQIGGSGGNSDLVSALAKTMRNDIRVNFGGNVQRWATGR